MSAASASRLETGVHTEFKLTSWCALMNIGLCHQSGLSSSENMVRTVLPGY